MKNHFWVFPVGMILLIAGAFGTGAYISLTAEPVPPSVPGCPNGSGMSYHEQQVGKGRESDVMQAYRDAGWDNVSLRLEGAGGFFTPPVIRVVSAECTVDG